MYIRRKIEFAKNRFKYAFLEKPDDELKTDEKSHIRYDIEKEVFDLPDSVADNSKMISLVISLVERMYTVMPDDQKELIPEQDRVLIDMVLNTFKQTTTIADEQLATEGPAMITKILDRQAKIANIVKQHKGV